jgi:hypothetical protein
MHPKRRIFWMLANAFLALFSSGIAPTVSVVFILTTSIWISHNAMVLAVEGRAK